MRKNVAYLNITRKNVRRKRKKKEGNVELKVSGQSQFQVIRIRKIDEALK